MITDQEGWNRLAEEQPELYTPNKLPFYKDNVLEEPAPELARVKSTASSPLKLFDMNRTEVDHDVKNLLYDEQTRQIAFPENEALLV